MAFRTKQELVDECWALLYSECYDWRKDVLDELTKKSEEYYNEQCEEFEELCNMVIVVDEFYHTYNRLAMIGVCDSAGGMEYRRVRKQWEDAGKPPNVVKFIKANA